MRDELFLLGRILFSLVFIGSGVGHLTQTASSAEYAAYKKVPSPKAMVQFTGVAMLLGGIAVILGIWMDLAALGIAIFTLAAGLMMHRFWEETDPQTKQVEMAQFMKNIAICGAALIIVAVGKYAPYTITDGVF
ncbi:MAG: DoxX family protein [Ilumatobacteraceae bacterium]